MRTLKAIAGWLMTASALAATPALAASGTERLDKLEAEIQGLQTQIQDLKASQASKYSDTQKTISELPKVTLDNGRPAFATANGEFTASLRALVQFDGGYYSQSNPPGPANRVVSGVDTPVDFGRDLSSGTNFRRARIGLEGKVFKDFDYSFIYDFGGSGVEAATISAAYLQYNFKPFAVRVGAFPPYANLEDSAGASDTLFLERASAVEIQRSLAGGDGRSAVALTASGDTYLASLAYTGARVGQSGFFDEQQALLGRLAWQFIKSADANVVIGVNGTYIFDPADVAPGANSASTGVNIQNTPELRVDTINLVSTGNLDTDKLTQWGVDAGANWKSLYIDGGYYQFNVDRRGAASDPDFNGWYTQASWVLTGESRRYDSGRASFRNPRVSNNFGSNGGWGAWEIAARYSVIDLNFHEGSVGTPLPAGGIRGGEQDIWTFGINWYANAAVKTSLNYQIVNVDRIAGTPSLTPIVGFPVANGDDIGQDVDQVSLRVQFVL